MAPFRQVYVTSAGFFQLYFLNDQAAKFKRKKLLAISVYYQNPFSGRKSADVPESCRKSGGGRSPGSCSLGGRLQTRRGRCAGGSGKFRRTPDEFASMSPFVRALIALPHPLLRVLSRLRSISPPGKSPNLPARPPPLFPFGFSPRPLAHPHYRRRSPAHFFACSKRYMLH